MHHNQIASEMESNKTPYTSMTPQNKWLRHFLALNKKNWILTKRNWDSTIIQLLVPLILSLLLYGLQYALQNNQRRSELIAPLVTPTINSIIPLPTCQLGSDRQTCYTVAYSPDNDPVVTAIMDRFQQNLKLGSSAFMAFADDLSFNTFIVNNPNSTQGAIHFSLRYSNTTKSIATLQGIRYTIQYNPTEEQYYGTTSKPVTGVALPMKKGLELAIFQTISPNSTTTTFDYGWQSYAHPEIQPTDVVSTFGPVFYLGALMFNVVIQLGQLVMEKELHLFQVLKQMGVSDSAYWISNLVWMMSLNLATVFSLIISGCIFQFKFFLVNSFGTYFFLFLLFAWSMIPIVFLLSVIVRQSKSATVLGFALFMIGIVIQSFSSTVFTADVTWYRVIFSFLPFALLSKGMADIGAFSNSAASVGLRWSERANSAAAFPLTVTYNWLILDFFYYLFLALYLSKVLPDESGNRQHLCFCVFPSFWCPRKCRRAEVKRSKADFASVGQDQPPTLPGGVPLNNVSADSAVSPSAMQTEEYKNLQALEQSKLGEDADVLDEIKRVQQYELDKQKNVQGFVETSPVRFIELGKIFWGRVCCCCSNHAKDFHAVRGLSLMLEKNRLFVLLGHNGAGKTTTFNMMTGLTQSTYGDAVVMGRSINNEMDSVTEFIGVCPQHDVLWEQLSPREHLAMFAAFKNLPVEQVASEIEERLEDVQLTYVGDKASSTFSGGMKRRLSVAISLVGNPQVVYLDEPTTGMDPISRRAVWDLILKVKRSRVTVLTTHSMEEADVLGDRIGIMKQGKFIAMGTTLHLKQKFGSGYRVSVIFESSLESGTSKKQEELARLSAVAQSVITFVQQQISSAKVISKVGNSVDFKMDQASGDKLPLLLAQLEANKLQFGISDIQLNLTTLEEVFLSVGALGGEHDERSGEQGTPEKSCLTKLKARPLWQKILMGVCCGVSLLFLLAIIMRLARSDSAETSTNPIMLTASAAMLSSSFTQNVWYQVPSAINASAAAQCALGDPFSFFVLKPVNNPSGLIFHFEGNFSCSNVQLCAPLGNGITLFSSTTQVAYDTVTAKAGLLDHANSKNPLQNYAHIYIPLCTADAHLGNQRKQYDAGISLYHVGAKNVELVLRWATAIFQPSSIQRLVVAGSEFGAVGATMWMSALKQTYSSAKVTLLVSSTQALFGPSPSSTLVFPGMAQVQAGLAAATAASFQAWSVNPAALPLQAMISDPVLNAVVGQVGSANFTLDNILEAYARDSSNTITVARFLSPDDAQQTKLLSFSAPLLTPPAALSAVCQITANSAAKLQTIPSSNSRDLIASGDSFGFSNLFVNNTVFNDKLFVNGTTTYSFLSNVVSTFPATILSTPFSSVGCPA